MRLYVFKWQVYSYKALSYRFGEPFCPVSASSRSKFYIQEPPHGSPNWLKVGLTLGTSFFLWIYVSTYPFNRANPTFFSMREILRTKKCYDFRGRYTLLYLK